MEILAFSLTWSNLLLSMFVVLVAATSQLKKSIRRTALPVPPGPRRFPIIGNLHNLAGNKEPHQLLTELSRKHGQLMQLQLGQIPTLVVSSKDAARALLKTNEYSFAERPAFLVVREVIYNCRDLVFAPYGDYWRTIRKIAVMELLTAKRVASFRHVRDAAVSMFLDEVVRAGSEPVNLSKHFYRIGNWAISRATFGNANSKHHLDHTEKMVNEIVKLANGMSLVDFFPTLESLVSTVTGRKSKMGGFSMKIQDALDTIVKEHLSRLEATNIDEQKEEDQDLMDVLLRHYQLQDLAFPLSIDDIKAVVLGLFIAGTDTSSSTLEWAMSEMMKNPDVMYKAQSEVRRIYQERGKIDESIIDELHYLKLVIKETLRLHPAAPLIIRQCRETCEVNGYLIPPKTRVIINAWALGRDSDYWVNPNEFHPERFQDRSLDFSGTDYQFLPFGAGRRMCPGAAFALANVEVTLAKILGHFDWKLPNGMRPDDLNMEEASGVVTHRKFPLCLTASSQIPI